MSTRSARFEWGFLDPGNQVLATDDNPGLRPAQQFVAAEGDDIGTVGQRLTHRGLGGQAPAGEVNRLPLPKSSSSGSSCWWAMRASSAVGTWVVKPGCCSCCNARASASRCAGRWHRLVVAGVGAVGGADLVQLYASTGHDVGDTECAANLDQFSPRNDAFFACTQAMSASNTAAALLLTTVTASAPVSSWIRPSIKSSRSPRLPMARSNSRLSG